MEQYGNIHVVGTTHIAGESIAEIESALTHNHFDIVALEMDAERMAELSGKTGDGEISVSKSANIFGLKGTILGLFGATVGNILAKATGQTLGSDMLKAYELAKSGNLEIKFIDQPLGQTLGQISSQMRGRELFRFFLESTVDLFKYYVLKIKEGRFLFDPKTVPPPEKVQRMMADFQRFYPNMFKVLISDRNNYIAAELVMCAREFPGKKILAVLGIGHQNGVLAILRQMTF